MKRVRKVPFKSVSSEVVSFLQTLFSFLGVIVWAWIGRILARYTESTRSREKFHWVLVFTELPVAIAMGIFLGGVSEYFIAEGWIGNESKDIIQSAMVATGSYLGPRVLEDIWKRYISGPTTNVYINTDRYGDRKEDHESSNNTGNTDSNEKGSSKDD